MTKEKQIAENIMKYALRRGADDCEIYWNRRFSASTQMRSGALSDDTAADRIGYSVRLIKKGVPGFAYGVTMDEASMRRSVDDALVSCAFLETDPFYHFTEGGKTYPQAPALWQGETGFSQIKAFLEEMTAAAKTDPRILRVERAAFGDSRGDVHILNSLGLDLEREYRYVSASATVVAAEGSEEYLGGDFRAVGRFDELDPVSIGQKAAEEGLDKLGASAIETEELPVLFRPEAVLDLLGIVLPSFLGDHVEKGMSRLKEMLGKIVASPKVSLFDDAMMAESVLKIPFDDEGQPCGRHCLIDHGTAEQFLYDNRYGKKSGAESTGNGFCGSHKALPTIGLSSFYLEKGESDLASLIGEQKKALWVKDLMGLHTADAVSGDFSLGAVGRLIENGEVTKSVRGVMIAGNLFDLLKDVEAVCDDFTVFGDVAAPSFLIKSLKISGK